MSGTDSAHTAAPPAGQADHADLGFHRPRPWAAPLARPAARIALAGGLTLAGWLLGAVIAGATADAADHPSDATVASTHTSPSRSSTGDNGAPAHHRSPGGPSTSDHDPGSSASSLSATAGSHHGSGGSTGSADSRAGVDPTGSHSFAADSADNTVSTSSPDPDRTGNSSSGEPSYTPPRQAGNPCQYGTSAACPGGDSAILPARATTTGTDGGSGSSHQPATAPTGAPAADSPSRSGITGDRGQGVTTGPAGSSTAADDTPSPVAIPVAPPGARAPGADPSNAGDHPNQVSPNQVSTPSQNEAASPPGAGLLGGLLGLVDGVARSVTGVVGTVGDVGSGVLPTVPGSATGDPALIPIDGVLGPVFSDGSVSGGVSATATAPVAGVVTAVAPTTSVDPAAMTAPERNSEGMRYVSAVRVLRIQDLGSSVGEPSATTSRVGAANGGGGGGGGLPSAPSAPAAPTPTANPGHDGPGGARQPFAIVADDVTTTQLKLIGVSRDHEIAGAGREAALPTTSPD
ncbi:MAG TPA: hypothetical protein VG674_05480 [Amycolatopsis sp.]|nr:hypothetical protein [Amycolatopsis sp.]